MLRLALASGYVIVNTFTEAMDGVTVKSSFRKMQTVLPFLKVASVELGGRIAGKNTTHGQNTSTQGGSEDNTVISNISNGPMHLLIHLPIRQLPQVVLNFQQS